uniref:MFS domain-containing protein n=1 Tax=Globodera pallida TaxID=36090 RepID=A0A183BNN5_GLOPA
MLTRVIKPLPVLITILLFDLLAFTLILPLFPSLIDHYSRLQKREPDPIFALFDSVAHGLQTFLNVPSVERHNSVFFGGILGSLFSLLQFLSSPVFGSLSDLHGRKPLLLVAVLGSLGSYCLWSLSSDSFSLFFLSRLLGGLSKASVSVAIAIVTDLMPTEQRGKGMAFVGGSFSLAFLIGPSIGAFFSIGARASAEFDPSPARLAMALTVAELALLLFLLPETLPRAKKGSKGQI